MQLLGRLEAARLPRDALAELREELGLARRRATCRRRSRIFRSGRFSATTCSAKATAPACRSPSTISSMSPSCERLGGADGVAAHDHLERLLHADHARQPLGAAGARQEARASPRAARTCAAGDAHAVVAGQGDLEPAAERGAVDGRDHRLRARSRSRRAPRGAAARGGGLPNSVMSAPAMKVRPAPMMTTACAAASATACARPSSSPWRTSRLSALTGGLSTVRTATGRPAVEGDGLGDLRHGLPR